MLWQSLHTVVITSTPYWVAFVLGEVRRRVIVGHWR